MRTNPIGCCDHDPAVLVRARVARCASRPDVRLRPVTVAVLVLRRLHDKLLARVVTTELRHHSVIAVGLAPLGRQARPRTVGGAPDRHQAVFVAAAVVRVVVCAAVIVVFARLEPAVLGEQRPDAGGVDGYDAHELALHGCVSKSTCLHHGRGRTPMGWFIMKSDEGSLSAYRFPNGPDGAHVDAFDIPER